MKYVNKIYKEKLVGTEHSLHSTKKCLHGVGMEIEKGGWEKKESSTIAIHKTLVMNSRLNKK